MKSEFIKRVTEKNLLEYLERVKMSERNKQIVKIYFSTFPTYDKLGKEYGISGERVRQILVRFSAKSYFLYRKDHPSEEEMLNNCRKLAANLKLSSQTK